MLPEPLAPLAAWPQFVAWRLEWNEARAKFDKIPYSPTHGRRASSTNPSDWGSYEQAAAMGLDGVGFVFTENDPFFFADIDGALVDGLWSQVAQDACALLAGAAVEVSQSGTGLHIIGSYTTRPNHRSRNTTQHLELYTKERFVALTGTHASGSVSTVLDVPLAAYIARYFDPLAGGNVPAEWTTEPVAEWSGPDNDVSLIEIALRSGSTSAEAAFGGTTDKVTFSDLWTADADALGARWPPDNNHDAFNRSSADQSLANALAFWTGRNCERIERIMRQSALVRDKWDREDYIQGTILNAVGLVTTVYKGRASAPAPSADTVRAAGYEPREGSNVMAHDQQMRHFEGCIYVSGPHKILTPRGDRLDQGRFDAVYGGYDFIVSPDGKKTTTSAWEAFTKAQTFTPPRADKLCFRPELGTGGIVETSGLRLANTYVEIETAATEGDSSPYLDLLAKQLPDERDRAILLNYMASCVQNKGLKAQWWPVVQGAEGNGKTIHMVVMMHALGMQYCHLPNTEKMIRGGMNFNGWVEGKLFLGLEEVYAPDRRQFFEAFKTTVTNRNLPIEGKGIEEDTKDNRANGIITTNHTDGVPIDESKRRYAALFTAQQKPADIMRDGMGGSYFPDLYDWLYGRNDYAHLGADYGLRVINHYLRTFDLVAELDPNRLATRAPVTSSMGLAVTASMGRVEQEVLEAIEEGRPGFANGWVSSIRLDDLLEQRRIKMPRNKRRDMLLTLGYDWHPALAASNGRVNNVVAPDNGKPRLFCKINSLAWNNLTEPASVAKAYSDAQTNHAASEAQRAFDAK